MGAYLSEPVTNKISTDEQGKRVNCGASSMQGWRVSQEDAHNCLLEFDADTSLFAVYDGHGGHEVAEYCAANLPEFLKKCENYTKGEFIDALQEAFLGFDAKLATPEVIAILKEISGKKDEEENSVSDEEENICNLKEEAEMPLDEVMAKYKKDSNPHLKNLKPGVSDKSPYIRRRPCTSEASGSGSGSCSLSASGVTAAGGSSSLGGTGQNTTDIELKVPNIEADQLFDSAISNGNSETKEAPSKEAEEQKQQSETSNNVGDTKDQVSSIESEEIKTENEKIEEIKRLANKKQEVNGEVGASGDGKLSIEFVAGEVLNTPPPHENGVAPYEGKGKGKAIVTKEESNAKATNYMALRRHAAAALYKSLLGPQENSGSESDSDDDGDESFEGAAESSDDDLDEAEDNEDEGEDEAEEEEEDDESMGDDEDDEEDDFTMKMTEEPGSDSGCTAVVALLHGRELYVANAGDSRCVVCRKGQAVEMSLDHKPEDELEMQRIVKAGGKVTTDGRVNGGLNLSRALGDHAYKLNSKLPAQEQMITALPDVRTLLLDPEEDEFIILACDGIWNFMSSQEVCDFVRPRLQEGKVKLSHICEELFDHCLAANTLGDGTGCDNMTAVLVQVKPSLAEAATSKSTKRLASPAKNLESVKRSKTEEPV